VGDFSHPVVMPGIASPFVFAPVELGMVSLMRLQTDTQSPVRALKCTEAGRRMQGLFSFVHFFHFILSFSPLGSSSLNLLACLSCSFTTFAVLL